MSEIDSRPGVAVISNSHTPYRLHLHQRITTEIPEVKLWSIYTHEISNAPWHFGQDMAAGIGAVLFGKGESSESQSALRHSLREWMRAGRIISWIVEHDIRFVLMMGYNDLGRVRIIRWCRRVGIPCWLFGDSNILGDRDGGLKGLVKRPFVTAIVAWCDGVFCCGSLGLQYFQKYGAVSERCRYFPYEPDYELISSLSDAAIDQARQRFALCKRRRRIVFSGRLVEVKRADLVVAAFVAISDQRPDWDLLMIGDGPLRKSLEAGVPRRLVDRIVWTGFLDDQATMSALYRASDVLVMPSDKEPWGLVINEAVAAGLAIVSSDVIGASAELVRDGVNGRIFPAGDLAALIKCLLDVTDNTQISAMKAGSPRMLADWRCVADPVNGLREALVSARVLAKGTNETRALATA